MACTRLKTVNSILILKNDPHQGKTHVWRAYPIQPRLTISMTQNQDDHHLGRPRTSTSLIQLVPGQSYGSFYSNDKQLLIRIFRSKSLRWIFVPDRIGQSR